MDLKENRTGGCELGLDKDKDRWRALLITIIKS
jgi:hypothetical protein